MLSRRLFLCVNAAAAASVSLAQGTRDYWNDWPVLYTAMVRNARAGRKKELASISTAAQAQARNAKVRDTVWRLIGGPLQKTPLNARVMGTLERPGYRIDKVIFESQPQVYVTTNVYIPAARKPPFPGIVSPLGHYWEGKARREYQHLYQNLARQGFVVIAFDPIGLGERAQYIDPGTGASRYSRPTMEHNRAGLGLRLVGDTFTQYCEYPSSSNEGARSGTMPLKLDMAMATPPGSAAMTQKRRSWRLVMEP